MKTIKNVFPTLAIILAFGVLFTVTSCSKTAKHTEETEDVEGAEMEATDAEGTEAEGEATDGEGTEGDAAEGEATEGGSTYEEGTMGYDITNWISTGSGSKSFTLTGIGWEGEELSAEGRSQLDMIASIMEANPDLKAEIQGHTDEKANAVGKKTAIGTSKARAVWTKAKLIIGHDAVGKNISTKGYGDERLLEGVAGDDPSQKRITIEFTK